MFENINFNYIHDRNWKQVMSFEVEKFTSAPSVEELNTLKKAELLQLVNHYHLTAVLSTDAQVTN